MRAALIVLVLAAACQPPEGQCPGDGIDAGTPAAHDAGTACQREKDCSAGWGCAKDGHGTQNVCKPLCVRWSDMSCAQPEYGNVAPGIENIHPGDQRCTAPDLPLEITWSANHTPVVQQKGRPEEQRPWFVAESPCGWWEIGSRDQWPFAF